jgi:5'-3' exonuclease
MKNFGWFQQLVIYHFKNKDLIMNVLLFDVNNLAIRNLFTPEIGATSDDPQYQLWKFEIFSQIYWSIIKHRPVSEVVLAVDGPNSWRKALFPKYKSGRVKKEDVDWDMVYTHLNMLCTDIQQNIPFKTIKLPRTEADDTIGVLAETLKHTKDVIIVSNDIDYMQCTSDNVCVFNPTKKEFVTLNEDRETFINRMILKGQSKDTIFNVKTPSDYPDELRKPGLGDKTVDKILNEGLDQFLEKKQKINKNYTDDDGNEQTYHIEFAPKENFDRNKKLLLFDYIPNSIRSRILDTYNNYTLPDPNNMLSFFQKNGWNSFLDNYEITEKVLLKLY